MQAMKSTETAGPGKVAKPAIAGVQAMNSPLDSGYNLETEKRKMLHIDRAIHRLNAGDGNLCDLSLDGRDLFSLSDAKSLAQGAMRVPALQELFLFGDLECP